MIWRRIQKENTKKLLCNNKKQAGNFKGQTAQQHVNETENQRKEQKDTNKKRFFSNSILRFVYPSLLRSCHLRSDAMWAHCIRWWNAVATRCQQAHKTQTHAHEEACRRVMCAAAICSTSASGSNNAIADAMSIVTTTTTATSQPLYAFHPSLGWISVFARLILQS